MSCENHEVDIKVHSLSMMLSEITPQPSFADFNDQGLPSLKISPKLSPIVNNNQEVSIDSFNEIKIGEKKSHKRIFLRLKLYR